MAKAASARHARDAHNPDLAARRIAPVSAWVRFSNDRRVLAYLFLAPALAILAFTVVYPFFQAITISFTNKMAGASASFIGLANYRELIADPVFLKVLINTFQYTLLGVGIKFLLGLTMALVLSQERTANYIFKTILFVPWAVPPVVAALNWRWIYDDFSGLGTTSSLPSTRSTSRSPGPATSRSPCSASSPWSSGRARPSTR